MADLSKRGAAAASLGQGNKPKFTLSCSFKSPAGQGWGHIPPPPAVWPPSWGRGAQDLPTEGPRLLEEDDTAQGRAARGRGLPSLQDTGDHVRNSSSGQPRLPLGPLGEGPEEPSPRELPGGGTAAPQDHGRRRSRT